MPRKAVLTAVLSPMRLISFSLSTLALVATCCGSQLIATPSLYLSKVSRDVLTAPYLDGLIERAPQLRTGSRGIEPYGRVLFPALQELVGDAA